MAQPRFYDTVFARNRERLDYSCAYRASASAVRGATKSSVNYLNQ